MPVYCTYAHKTCVHSVKWYQKPSYNCILNKNHVILKSHITYTQNSNSITAIIRFRTTGSGILTHIRLWSNLPATKTVPFVVFCTTRLTSAPLCPGVAVTSTPSSITKFSPCSHDLESLSAVMTNDQLAFHYF